MQQLTGCAHMSIQAVRCEDASSFVPGHVDIASGTSDGIRCYGPTRR